MKVSFEMRVPPGRSESVEYVLVEVPNGDVVHRRATNEDRLRWGHEHQAFKAPAPAPAPRPVEKPAPAAVAWMEAPKAPEVEPAKASNVSTSSVPLEGTVYVPSPPRPAEKPVEKAELPSLFRSKKTKKEE
jgi:hypothetical protein